MLQKIFHAFYCRSTIKAICRHPSKRRMFAFFGRLFSLVTMLAFAFGASADIRSNGWNELKTTNFTLITDLPVHEAEIRIQEWELFRAVVLRVTNAQRDSRGLSTKAYVFSRTKDFRQITNKRGVGGWFRPSLRGNVMAYPRELPGFEDQLAVQHEYVHSIMAASGAVYPMWYREGLADMLGAIYVKDDRVVIGGEIKGRITRLSYGDVYVPLSRIISKEDVWNWNPYLTSYFYSIAWATVNYFYTGSMVGKSNHGQNLPKYLNLISSGESSAEAFQAAFGISPKKMEKEILEFLTIKRRGVLAIPVDRFDFNKNVDVRSMDSNEVRYEIGYLMVARNPKEARKLFRAILKEEPENKRAKAGVAVSWQMEAEWEKGLAQAEMALDENDYLPNLEYADMIYLYCTQSESSQECEGLLTTAIALYEKVLALKPGDPEGSLGLAKSYSLVGKNLEVGLGHAEAVRRLVPTDPEVNYLLGHIYLQMGKSDDALIYLLKASKLTHNEPLLKLIRLDLVTIDAAYGKDFG